MSSSWKPMDWGPPGSSVHGISHARILEWVAISSSRGSSQSKYQTHISWIGRQILYHWTTWEVLSHYIHHSNKRGRQGIGFSRLEYYSTALGPTCFQNPPKWLDILTRGNTQAHASLQRHSHCPLRWPLRIPSSCHTASYTHTTSAQGSRVVSFSSSRSKQLLLKVLSGTSSCLAFKCFPPDPPGMLCLY